MMYISYYLLRLVFVSASAQQITKLQIFFETSAIVDNVSYEQEQKSYMYPTREGIIVGVLGRIQKLLEKNMTHDA